MRSTLRLRLMVMIFLVLLPAAVIIAYDVFEARNHQVEDSQLQGRQLAQVVSSSIDRVISHVEGTLDLLTQVPQVRRLQEPDCSRLLAEIVATQKRFATIAASDPSGTIGCASNPKAVGISTADRAWFQQVTKTQTFTVADYTIGKISGKPVLGFALPIRGPGGGFAGVAYASVDLGWFGTNDIGKSLPGHASFTLVDQNGQVMARHPDGENWVTKSIADTPLFAAMKKDGGVDFKVADLDGKETFFHLVQLRSNPEAAPIYLAVGLHLDERVNAINRNTGIKIGLLLVIAGIVAAFSFLTSTRMISRPVQNMVDLSSRIAGGDLTVRSGLAHDQSEFGRLAQSLDSMAQSLERNREELEHQQRYMRAVLDNTSEMIFCYDTDGRIAFVNAAASALKLPEGPQTYQQMIEASGEIFDRDMKPLPYDQIPLVRVVNGEDVVNTEISIRKEPGGPIVTLLINGQQIVDDDGRRLGIVNSVRDITALRGAEASLRQSQKMEAVGQLTGGIAHDFNNLLGVIIGSVDTLLPHLTDPDDIEIANEALNGALRGASLTRQMLAFARRQALSPTVLALGDHLTQLSSMLRRTLGENIQVSIHCAPDLWPCLVDAGQLDSVILNLAINARDAMPEGGHLTIEANNVPLDDYYAETNAEVSAGNYVRISVSDNGAGIPPDILSRVMEPFFTTKEPGKGTGLGLSMAFGFAKQSGGHLKIYSEVGHGTTVNLYIPCAEKLAQAPTLPSEERRAPKGAERILLVDDNEAVRKTAARMLHDLGYRVVEASNGSDALRILSSDGEIDLLFSDVVMPGGVSGFDLAAQAEELYPRLKVLLVTGFAEAAVRNGVSRGRNVSLMSKPYRRQELAERIRSLLDSIDRSTAAK